MELVSVGLGTFSREAALSFLKVQGVNRMSDQRNQEKQKGGQGDQHQAHMATDQISFYDESLKKEVEGSFVSDGKSIHVSSAYGTKSAPYGDLGACIDHNSQVLLAQKLLSELERDAGVGKKSVQQREEREEAANKLGSARAVGGT
jgi:hypothetical protein